VLVLLAAGGRDVAERLVTSCPKSMDYVLCFTVVLYRDSEIQVFGEPGYCPGRDGQAANECPAYSYSV
jgi:hypothetical protein